MYDIVIVGGGPAGLTAALYALRANKTVLVIDKSAFGGQMTLSPKIENYPGQESPSGIDLADRMTEQILTRGAEVELDEVTGIQVNPDGTKKVVAQYGEYDTKAVIIANGAKHRALGLEREVEFTGKGVYYCAVCDGGFFRNKEVALVGGGNSALQEAVFLSGICSRVTVIQNLAFLTGEERLIDRVNALPNVEILFQTEVKRIVGEEVFEGVEVQNTETGEKRTLEVSAMFVAIGLAPDNKMFENVAKLDQWGYFDAGEAGKTSTPGVFVAGDCRSKRVRQITTAAADGTLAALAACEYIDCEGDNPAAKCGLLQNQK